MWKRKWNPGLLPAICLLGGLLGPGIPHAAVGDLPVVNVMQGQGTFGMPFNQPASGQQIAIFLISNNTSTAFDVAFHFANVGKFKNGSQELAMSGIVLNGISGTLGAGLTAPVNQAVALNGSGDWVWDPGSTQTTETVNYLVELKASWPDGSNKLAGFYFESITATISIGL